MLFGKNPLSPLLLQVLDIDQPGGQWQSGRFRDIYTNEDGTRILLYTRNGGGNRDHWNDEAEAGPDCRCTGCIITHHLPQHPQYVCDYNDDFDCTYATVEFRVPEAAAPLVAALATGVTPATVHEKFDHLLRALESGEQTAETERALAVGRAITEQIQAHFKTD